MRILICTNAYPPHFMGGAELVAHEQAKLLVGSGHEVEVFAGDIGAVGERHSRIEGRYEGVRLHRIKTDPEDYNPEFLNFLHSEIDDHFRSVLRDFRPDIVHFHNLIGLSVKLPIIARSASILTICTLHDLWGFCLKNTAIRWDGAPCRDISLCGRCLPRIHDGRGLDVPIRFRKDTIKLALDHIDHFIAPSQYIADRYVSAGLSAKRISVIPNGIDIDRFSPSRHSSEDGPVRISFVGHFGAHKGVSTLLSALSMLEMKNRVRLQLAGEGPEKERYLSEIDALGIGEAVYFCGQVKHTEIADIYDRSDIVVLPSVWDENQPVCLMEAMASGLPVVASNKGGIPELIEHGRNGLLFNAGDANDLARQLDRLIDMPALRRAMGLEGRRRVESLTYKRQIELQVARYQSIAVRSPENATPPRLAGFIGECREGTRVENAMPSPGLEDRPEYLVPYQWMSDSEQLIFGRFFLLTAGPISRVLRLMGKDTVIPYPDWIYSFRKKVKSWISSR